MLPYPLVVMWSSGGIFNWKMVDSWLKIIEYDFLMSIILPKQYNFISALVTPIHGLLFLLKPSFLFGFFVVTYFLIFDRKAVCAAWWGAIRWYSRQGQRNCVSHQWSHVSVGKVGAWYVLAQELISKKLIFKFFNYFFFSSWPVLKEVDD